MHNLMAGRKTTEPLSLKILENDRLHPRYNIYKIQAITLAVFVRELFNISWHIIGQEFPYNCKTCVQIDGWKDDH